MNAKRQCGVDGCSRKYAARGYCYDHYYSWKTYGDPLQRMFAPKGAAADFLRAALSHDGSACLLWPYAASHGYAVAVIDGRQVRGTRWVCEQAHGAPPTPVHEAAHNCGNERCVSPPHLRWATHQDNCADRLVHGTQYRGDQCSWSKLTDEDVSFIRASAGKLNQYDLAERFGVSQAHISNLQRGKRRHAKGNDIAIPGVEIVEDRVL